MTVKKKCFIIQPFADEYKKRCDETYKPAIEKAGLEPYRIDEHYSATKMMIQSIKEEIEKSAVCLADITEKNPNVWYEVGFADGHDIPVVLICDSCKRKNLPFDVNQRNTYFYGTASQGDWQKLREEITKRLKIAFQEALARAKGRNEEIDSHDGSEYERADLLILKILYYDSGDAHSKPRLALEEKMRQSRFVSMDRTDAFTRLESDEMIEPIITVGSEIDGGNTYKLTEEGTKWCLKNKELLRGLKK